MVVGLRGRHIGDVPAKIHEVCEHERPVSKCCLRREMERRSSSLCWTLCFPFLSPLSTSCCSYVVVLSVKLVGDQSATFNNYSTSQLWYFPVLLLVRRSCLVAVKDSGATWSFFSFSQALIRREPTLPWIEPWRLSIYLSALWSIF